MSSSKPQPPVSLATAWTLDELPMPDVLAMSAEPAGVDDTDVDLHAHFAAERTRLEALAYERGYQDAERAAREAAEARVAQALRALDEAVASVQLHSERWIANVEENLSALATVVARYVVEREVSVDPSIIRELVQRALSQFPMDQMVTVRLHPEDAATCSLDVGSDSARRVRDVRWIADPHITRGGCLVEGRERIIDGRVDTSLERAYRAVGQVQA